MPTSTKSIREIMATHPSAAKVLERFEIDLCSQADNSLLCACRDLQLSVDQVLEKLADAECEESGSLAPDPAALPIGRLIQYIVRVHHQMVRQELPLLAELAHRLTTQQSGCEPELQRVADLLEKLRAEMFQHIQKEEQVLFPYISQMDQDSVIAYEPAHACFQSVTQPVLIMGQEHEAIDRSVAELSCLTNGFEAPSGANATHVALLAGLRAFEADLKQHFHLEDAALFPRAIRMEAELKKRN